MKLGNRLSTGLVLSLGLVMVVSFQNCGKKMSTENLSSVDALASVKSENEGSVNMFDHNDDVVTSDVVDSRYITIASKTNKAAPLTSIPDPENPGFGKVTSICTLCVNFVDLLPGQDARTLDAYKIAYFNQNQSGNDFISKTIIVIKKAPTTDYYHGLFTEETLLHAIAEYAFLKDLSAEQEKALVDLYNQLK